MSLIKHELGEVRKLCENCITKSKLIVCMENMFSPDYPDTPILFELKSKIFSCKLLKKLTGILEEEAKKILGKPQILPLLKFLNSFLEENTLSICYDEISNIKLLLSADKDEIKLKQKISSTSLKVTEGLYFFKIKFIIPIEYYNKAVSIQDCHSNFPPALSRFVVGQSTELARQCIEPPAARLVKTDKKSAVKVIKNNQPFSPSPSLEKVASFIIHTVKSLPVQKCQVCSVVCLPANPEDAERDEAADAHIERLYCGHLIHYRCLVNYLKTPPFKGDSAGANLNLGAALKCIEYNVRKPNGLFLAYVPVLVSFVPSPARLLCLMDPLLPFGFMMRCLKAYACPNSSSLDQKELREPATAADGSDLTPVSATGLTESETESFEEVTESDLNELVAHKSPLSDVSDTLTTVSLASSQLSKPEADQFLDQQTVNDLKKDLKLNLSNDEKYVLDSEMKDGKKIAVLRTMIGVLKRTEEQTTEKSAGLLRGMKSNVTNLISNTFTAMSRKSPGENTTSIHFLDSSDLKNPSDEFKFTVPKDPYLSPYWASDEVLRQLPPTSICSVQFDPCLDDCVMFAKKLKRLGNSVKLDILDGLPHGFLNFSMISKDADEGSKLCVKRIKDLLDLDSIACNVSNINKSASPLADPDST